MDNKSFDSDRIAEGYTKRPWLHKSVIDALKFDLDISDNYRYKNGLDVGCGAGLSTKALRLICEKVTGTDIAESMIRTCKEIYLDDPSYHFYVAKAEETRIPEIKYDIVTAAGCVNWVDEKRFMENMREVTDDGAVIVIYDFGITDRMVGNNEYTLWYQNEYLKRFPKTLRKEYKWTQQDLIEGFIMEKQTEYEMKYSFTIDKFVDFMMIQSNVNSRIECREESEKDIRNWMKGSLTPMFKDYERELVFYGYSWYIRNVSNSKK